MTKTTTTKPRRADRRATKLYLSTRVVREAHESLPEGDSVSALTERLLSQFVANFKPQKTI
jgi:hypothetical protein